MADRTYIQIAAVSAGVSVGAMFGLLFKHILERK